MILLYVQVQVEANIFFRNGTDHSSNEDIDISKTGYINFMQFGVCFPDFD